MQLGVEVKVSKKLDPIRAQQLLPGAQIFAAMAEQIKQRVFKDGRDSQGGDFGVYKRQSWRTTHVGTGFSDQAVRWLEVRVGRPRRFVATGGLRDSLTVSVTAAGSIRVFFAKSSTGYGWSYKPVQRNVSNNLKAWVSSQAAGKNILEPSNAELQPVIEYVAANARHAIDGTPLVSRTNTTFQGAFGPVPLQGF